MRSIRPAGPSAPCAGLGSGTGAGRSGERGLLVQGGSVHLPHAAGASGFPADAGARRGKLDFKWQLEGGQCAPSHYGLLLAESVGIPPEVIAVASDIAQGEAKPSRRFRLLLKRLHAATGAQPPGAAHPLREPKGGDSA